MMKSYLEIIDNSLKFIFENKKRSEKGLPIIELNHCPGCRDTGWDSEFDIEIDGPEPKSCEYCKYTH